MANTLEQPFNPLRWLGNIADNYAAQLMRNEVGEIIGSYHHTFDHFYECIQNAVDACEKAFAAYQNSAAGSDYIPLVTVVLDARNNQLTVVDNGMGMTKDTVLRYFFTPHATLKSASSEGGDVRQRGEKGVGATFLSYGTNYIQLSTKSKENGELTAGILLNGLAWCNEEQPLLPMPEVNPCEPHRALDVYEHGTAVTIQFDEDTNISILADYGVNWKQWETILRLYTAIGYIYLEGTDSFLSALQVSLVFINTDGAEETRLMEKGYLFPHLSTDANIKVSNLIRDERGALPQRHRDMDVIWEIFSEDRVATIIADRMSNLPHMRHQKRGEISTILNVHKPQAYVAFTWSADFWEERNDRIWGTELEGQLRYGLVFFTKSQKIGEQKRIDFRYRSGDFNRFFILLDMKNLKSDIGRKSLREEIVEFGNFFANAIQRQFTDFGDSLRPSPGFFDEGQEVTLETIKDRAFDRERLTQENLHLSRLPGEEQDVVALFFDLLGLGILRGYEVYSTHISRTYDGVGRFSIDDSPENVYDPDRNRLGIASNKFINQRVTSPSRCFIEFKYSTDGLVRDVRSGEKRLQDIKWLVCWEVGNRHVNEGIGITAITEPAFINQRDYYGVTHIMTEGQSKVFVICLRDVLSLANF